MSRIAELRGRINALPTRRMIDQKHPRVNLGVPPRVKSHAWWQLPSPARELLDQKRDQGLYGGKPGKAPYWWVQEQGEPKAEIVGKFYLGQALEAWSTGITMRWEVWITNVLDS